MKRHWFDRQRMRIKWRCPFYAQDQNTCPLQDQYSPSPYGRVVYIAFLHLISSQAMISAM